MVNKPLIRPYFWGRYVRVGWPAIIVRITTRGLSYRKYTSWGEFDHILSCMFRGLPATYFHDFGLWIYRGNINKRIALNIFRDFSGIPNSETSHERDPYHSIPFPYFKGFIWEWYGTSVAGGVPTAWRYLEDHPLNIWATKKNLLLSITHSIHVWYIYLHLVDFYGTCR